jgi:hypothetical protein
MKYIQTEYNFSSEPKWSQIAAMKRLNLRLLDNEYKRLAKISEATQRSMYDLLRE